MFEDNYDQLISLIRSSNKDCTIYVSKIVPRGEIDVSAFNHAVIRIVDHWAAHRVKCIDGSYDMFIGRNRMPSNRYFNEDGIHLTYSGTKRQLHAWNKHVEIVDEFRLCTFQSTFQKIYRPGGNTPKNHKRQFMNGNTQQGYNGQRRSNTRRCFKCSMPGHILTKCWNSQ